MTAAWPPVSTGAMNATSPPASSRARSMMRWSTTAWSSVEVSSRPIASSATASCRRRLTSAAARSRSMATAARSATLPHSAASVPPSAGPSRRPTSSAPIGSPTWGMGIAAQEVRVFRRGSVAQHRCASTSVESTGARRSTARAAGAPSLETSSSVPTRPAGQPSPATSRRRASPSTRRKTAARSPPAEALAMAATCAIASWTEAASSRPRKAARAFRSLVLMSSPDQELPTGGSADRAGPEPNRKSRSAGRHEGRREARCSNRECLEPTHASSMPFRAAVHPANTFSHIAVAWPRCHSERTPGVTTI